MKNDYSTYTNQQLDEAYGYYLKKIITIIHKHQSGYFLNKTPLKLELHEMVIEINKIRKIQRKPAIFITKIHVGDVSFYLEFF